MFISCVRTIFRLRSLCFYIINIYIYIYLYVYSEHIEELTTTNPRNVEQRHKEQFSKWFQSRVSTSMT